MADDKHYVPGDFYRICDFTGFKVRANRTRKEWNNFIVREQSWEPRQPQDFVRGTYDDQTVPEPRPRSVNVFIGPLGTALSANAANGATTIYVQSTIRMSAGDIIYVMMDNGIQWGGQINGLPNETTIDLATPLTWAASSGNPVIDQSAYSPPYIG